MCTLQWLPLKYNKSPTSSKYRGSPSPSLKGNWLITFPSPLRAEMLPTTRFISLHDLPSSSALFILLGYVLLSHRIVFSKFVSSKALTWRLHTYCPSSAWKRYCFINVECVLPRPNIVNRASWACSRPQALWHPRLVKVGDYLKTERKWFAIGVN